MINVTFAGKLAEVREQWDANEIVFLLAEMSIQTRLWAVNLCEKKVNIKAFTY